MSILSVALWVGLSRGGVDLAGKPLGTDFLSFWTAAKLALGPGGAGAAYVDVLHGASQREAFPGADVGYTPFPYPPTFLLLCLPLGALAYLPALSVWLGVTGLCYLRVVRAWVGGAFPSALAALAFPAVLLNAANGQNGFLTAALLGAGALVLPRRPVVAGFCFGLLTFKPHLGLLIPLALLAAHQWRAIASAALTALGLAAASVLTFGAAPWAAFLKTTGLMRRVIETDLLDPGKLQSIYGALRVWGAPVPAAYAVQAVVSLGVAAIVVSAARRRPPDPATGAVLIAGTLLASPYLLDYDLVLAAIPMAWVLREAVRTRFLPFEKIVLLSAYVLPLVSRVAAMKFMLPLAPPVLIALLAITCRRALMADRVGVGPASFEGAGATPAAPDFRRTAGGSRPA